MTERITVAMPWHRWECIERFMPRIDWTERPETISDVERSAELSQWRTVMHEVREGMKEAWGNGYSPLTGEPIGIYFELQKALSIIEMSLQFKGLTFPTHKQAFGPGWQGRI